MSQLSDKELIKELEKRFVDKQKSLIELQELTEELQKLNLKLEESENLKSNFLSNIRNQIINPFASILGLSKNIQTMPMEDWKRVKLMAKLIFNEAFNLDFQLRNIFAAARLEAGDEEPDIAKIDVNEFIEGVIESFGNKAEEKEVKIIHTQKLPNDEIKYFKTDAIKLELIISNLLSNAIKYSNATSKIEIKALIYNSNLSISVQDFGVGISEEDKKIIFNRFIRLDQSINSLNKGHGLGLAVTKAMLDILGGTIEINSKKTQGSIFVVNIPEAEFDTGLENYLGGADEFIF